MNTLLSQPFFRLLKYTEFLTPTTYTGGLFYGHIYKMNRMGLITTVPVTKAEPTSNDERWAVPAVPSH